MTTIDGSIQSAFSQTALDLQKGFCCFDTDTRKLIRWVGCKPGVYVGQKTVFSSEDFAMCSWLQVVDNYSYATVLLQPGEIATLPMDSKYLMMRAKWPADTYESMKVIELGIPQQAGYVGMTIPFPIEENSELRYMIMKDLFTMNFESKITNPIKLNNISPYEVSISMLSAK